MNTNIVKKTKALRKQFIIWLFEHSQRIYTSLFKNHESWNLTKKDLLKLPKPTFGRHLGEFLDTNNFELIPKVERHDCYHVLCNYSTKVEDEIALQCLCFGNGKRSPYLYGAIILGVAIYQITIRITTNLIKQANQQMPFTISIIGNF